MESRAGGTESAAAGFVEEGWSIGLPIKPGENAGWGRVETEMRGEAAAGPDPAAAALVGEGESITKKSIAQQG